MPEETAPLPDQYYIQSPTPRADERTRVLKHGDTFAVFDRLGNFDAFGRNEFGLFHRDTRFLSRLVLRLNGGRWSLLSSALKKDNALHAVDLMNPDLTPEDDRLIPHGTLHAFRAQAIWGATSYDRVRIHNYGLSTVRFTVGISVAADFADIFEVRGTERTRRGRSRPVETHRDTLVFGYKGLDDRQRWTRLQFFPSPTTLSGTEARFEIELASQESTTLEWRIACEVEDAHEPAAALPAQASPEDGSRIDYTQAAENAVGASRAAREAEPGLTTDNEQFNDWLNRSLADLHTLRTETPHGPYPYAGVPWFSTAFGRDGLLTALECLWFAPAVARGVLSFLAAKQAATDDPKRDAEPGKILHETRQGEMAALGEVPFARYYGSVDATPLFVVLAGTYYDRTGDLDFIRTLWPHIERALDWIDTYGDVDGDDFVEYTRRSDRGLVHQGWKDSQDAVFHKDGAPASGPIALCEVQGYVFAAKKAAARLSERLGDAKRADRLNAEAEQLQEQYEAAFWCDEIATYALALDRDNVPCRVRTSNPGHCLLAGIASAERARVVKDTLMGAPSFSGWGVRTVASTEARYNPISYHNGSIWPHDNAIIAAGLGRYGYRDEAARILQGLFEASLHFDLHRLPELFCGFDRRSEDGPTQYPGACRPQAWAAAAPLLCLQASLGLDVDGVNDHVCFRNPHLPSFLKDIEITDLPVGRGRVDMRVTRHDADVSVQLMRRTGPVDVTIEK